MTAPKLRDYVNTRDGLGAMPVYRTSSEEHGEIQTILKPDPKDGEYIVSEWTLRDYMYYVSTHPTRPEAKDAFLLLEELINLTD